MLFCIIRLRFDGDQHRQDENCFVGDACLPRGFCSCIINSRIIR